MQIKTESLNRARDGQEQPDHGGRISPAVGDQIPIRSNPLRPAKKHNVKSVFNP